jgi:hypothetical protein
MTGPFTRAASVAAAEALRRLMVAAVGIEYRRFVAATERPREVQRAKLLDIVATNASTAYGRLHNFDAIRSVADFQRTVPIVAYEELRPYISRMMAGESDVLTRETPYQYLLTSGSASEPKYIPVTKRFRREYASPLQFYYLYRQYPDVFRPGAFLTMVSPAVEGRTATGVPYGAASGLTYESQNAFIKTIYAIPYDAFTIKQFDAKYYSILRFAVEEDIRLVIMANPSSVTLLLKELNQQSERLIEDVAHGTLDERLEIDGAIRQRLTARLRPNPARARELNRIRTATGGSLSPTAIWPRLRAVVCWRDASAALYLPDLERALAPVPVFNLGYAASEGLGTFRLFGPGAEVLAITSHFFEFCEEDTAADSVGTTRELRLADELEPGRRYSIVMTTSGGLYRYHIDDIVEVRGFVGRTPALRFVQKGTNSFSFTGEKLTEAQVIDAVSGAAAECGVAMTYFTVVPVFAEAPYYDVMLESPLSSPATLEQLAPIVDARLSRLNVEFDSKRRSRRLAPTRVSPLPMGFFDYYRRLSHERKRDAQMKFKHLNPDPLFHEALSVFGLQAARCVS